jgi:hypothetical protein
VANGGFMPKVTEHAGEYIFELRDEVFIAVTYASEKKLRFQLWRKDVMLPPTEGNIFLQSFRDQLVKQAREAFSQKGKRDRIPHIEEDIAKVSTIIGSRGDRGKNLQQKLQDDAQGGTMTEGLIKLAEERAHLFKTPEKQAHAVCQRAGHTEVMLVENPQFRRWLRNEFKRNETERLQEVAQRERDRLIESLGALANEEVINAPLNVRPVRVVPATAIANAVEELRDSAIEDGPTEQVFVRVAGYQDRVYLDLANDNWEAVEITKEGRNVIPSEQVPVRFVRSDVMLPLPYPTRDGSLDDLKKLLTIPQAKSEESWSLILSWLVQALAPCEGDYPILVLMGGHGTAKSTHTEILRALVDPLSSAHESEETYYDLHTLFLHLVKRWILAVDNVDTLPSKLSNRLARISSGAGIERVMNLRKSRIEMRISRSAWSPRDLCFPHF